MASPDQPPAKKAKLRLEDNQSIMPTYDTPRKHSMAELYNPKIVDVTVFDSETQPDVKEEFTVPRGLICQSSAYFDKLFKGPFHEGKTGSVVLDDVEPWIFRCFVGWLYQCRVFLECVDGPVENSYPPKDGTNESGTSEAAKNVESSHMTDTADEERRAQESQKVTSVFNISQGRGREDCTSTQSDTSAQSPASTTRRPMGPESRAGEDLDEPITWHWTNLFGLYLFADKYDASDFRSETLIIIQMKIYARRLCGYKAPRHSAIEATVTRLSASAPLVRFLADVFGVMIHFNGTSALAVDPAKCLSKLPSDFLGACFVSSKRHIFALKCKSCLEGKSHGLMHGHTSVDFRSLDERDPCLYHEHEEGGEEARRCAQRWESWKMKLREAESQAEGKKGEKNMRTSDV